ncbi:hypothetical protein ABOM_010186 [Aspergillus bombycis]|uniref:Diphthamide biosynthesis protein 3 n=1 Tax=Aspergillus bombycis TaxID=109264 RepID=A0A1F7ZPY2_9EURO|nr:hypothetical protein ABOM_010186 [Aspergillus bombycis]OGM41105.1 hypothetical protein ABOM_010186 [Aspergillus bombycis]
MLPPCDPAILENNPQFKRLYRNLTTNLLHPDASTRANHAQPARKAVLEYRCTIAIISLYLDSSSNQLDLDGDDVDGADALSLLAPDIDKFYSNLPALIRPFSNAISSSLSALRLIANAGDASNPLSAELSRPRTRARQSMMRAPSLSPQLEDRLRKLRQKQLSELPAARTRMAATAGEVLATRAAVLERTVVLLERAKHGALARATKAKAEHLATVARGMEGKLRMTKLDICATIHTPETLAALSRYRQHLQDTRERLVERKVSALEELKAYEVDDSGVNDRAVTRGRLATGPIGEITRQYGDLIREIEDVRNTPKMADEALSIYDEIEIEDMTFDPVLQIYHYPCPCGDRFEIAIDDLRDGEEIAVCPSCSLMIRVIFDVVRLHVSLSYYHVYIGVLTNMIKDDLPKDDQQQGPGAVAVQA